MIYLLIAGSLLALDLGIKWYVENHSRKRISEGRQVGESCSEKAITVGWQ